MKTKTRFSSTQIVTYFLTEILRMRLHIKPVPIAQMVERPLRERDVVGSIPGRAIPKALKMVPVATLLGAQHNKASTGSSLTHY